MRFDPDAIMVSVDRAAVRDAVVDLRHETIRSLALCKDIIDRLAEHRERAPEQHHD